MATTTSTTTLSTADASELNTLRAELKQWEKAFADANGGRKAGRHDIKQDPEIAAKYKTYGRLRALEEPSCNERSKDVAKTPSKSDQHHARTKRKYGALSTDQHTPRKARRELSTPAKNQRVASDPLHPAVLDPYDSPTAFRRLFSPTTHRQQPQQQPSPLPLKTAIGPTPQRNGKLLGLFDMLSASGGSTVTPSVKRTAALDRAIIQTPSRSKVQRLGDIPEMADNEGIENEGNGDDDDDSNESAVAMGRTPASSSKKLYLERLFATPTTLRFATMIEEEEGDDDIDGSQQIPWQITQPDEQDDTNPLGSGTPSFLRRSNSGRYASNNAFANNPLSPVGVRKHQRFNGKGLTALVQGLRDMEKERMQDDWDILNELEVEQRQNAARTEEEEDIQVGDSQVPHNEADNKSGPGGKTWKKKTQKRTTRLVKMKPVIQTKNRASRTTATVPTFNKSTQEENKSEHESEDELATLDDSRMPAAKRLRERKQHVQDDNENDEDSNYDSIDSSSDKDFTTTESAPKPPPPQQQQKRLTSSFTDKIKAAFSSIPVKDTSSTSTTITTTKKAAGKEKSNEKSSPKRRKVNPDAHANYRSLKIRSKGQGRFGRGRFGRR
ncbi:hypothetical protein UA08_02859 [Talaromyces atroroseus]|uniref:DNA replication regulator SLD2 n=1 Tax=Talaromyces atroroseus TaxID=1441469 RepID=A0A225AK02_TALAT|nr:hypothetical protein UA08_02859 [Talaromyces atroroseus]OKL61852.1 hypothetical protein UA08_02859 [Talaromyces atroroseus]